MRRPQRPLPPVVADQPPRCQVRRVLGTLDGRDLARVELALCRP